MTTTTEGARASDPDPNLNPHEAAVHIGVSRKTLTRWRQRGEGPPCTIVAATIVRYRKSAIDAWLSARTSGGVR